METGTSTVNPAQVWKATIPGKTGNGLGFPFFLILIYLFMEYGRPANPMGMPMVISIFLLLNWLRLPQKKWPPQIICFFALLAVIAVMGPFAENNAAVFWGFEQMTVLLLCVCVPIMHFVCSMRKVSIFLNFLIC